MCGSSAKRWKGKIKPFPGLLATYELLKNTERAAESTYLRGPLPPSGGKFF